MSLESDQIKLSIQIQNEFGWTIKDENVYGPGSVIQGQVDMEIFDPALIEKADSLRIVFHGSERTRSKTTKQGVRRRQFFGTQRKLWQRKNSSLSLHTKYSYPFTLQLPMIQFPPTINSDLYRCYLMFSVFLDQAPSASEEINLALCDLELHYQPFLETCLFKTPLKKILSNKSMNNHNVSLSTHALDYVPGDTILIDVAFELPSPFLSIEMDLYQSTLLCSGEANECLISSLQQPIPLSSSSLATSMKRMNLGLSIPIGTTPSFSFSDMASVSYKLVIRFKEKKGGITSLLSPTTMNTLEFPIRIGTLGYGIRAPESLQVYSVFKTAFDTSLDQRPSLPLPAFIKNIEYEESLPLYQSDRLPAYDDSLCHYAIPISAPSPASSC